MNLVNDLKSGAVTLNQLETDYGFKIRHYPDMTPPRVCLNYSQIESPKFHPYTIQARGLVLNSDDFSILCLPFDRFFNLGEGAEQGLINSADWSKAKCVEKLDGSLIKIYWDGHKWNIATRGCADAVTSVHGFPVSFQELVLKALGFKDMEEFNLKCLFSLTFLKTYLFELTARENRVVTQYNECSLWYLGTRCELTGKYEDTPLCAQGIGAKLPKSYSFESEQDCLDVVAHLPDLQEGYVVWQDNKPLCKVKSPAYVAVHHIRGEGLNPKRIAQLVLTGEEKEYLTYFPEDEQYITPYTEALAEIRAEIDRLWYSVKDIADQKEFALAINHFEAKGVLFTARSRNLSIHDAYNHQKDCFKLKMLMDKF